MVEFRLKAHSSVILDKQLVREFSKVLGGINLAKAVVLLSGGLDSTVCLALALKEGHEVYPLSFNYGQRHKQELEQAKKIAGFFNLAQHLIIDIGLKAMGGSALTSDEIEVPEGDIERKDIPVTYVPARNMVFLSFAIGYAEVLEAAKVYIGVNALDYSGYPDCRPEFIQSFQQTANLATKAGVGGQPFEIVTPLINLTKKEIIELGTKVGAPLNLTYSCYRGGETACGTCDSCRLRLKGFSESGMPDPILYAQNLP